MTSMKRNCTCDTLKAREEGKSCSDCKAAKAVTSTASSDRWEFWGVASIGFRARGVGTGVLMKKDGRDW